MIKQEKNGLSYYQFRLFQGDPHVIHAIFSRHGGVSPSVFKSLNVSSLAGDSLENVKNNILRISQALGGYPILTAKQVHGNKVLVFSKKQNDYTKQGKSIQAVENEIEGDAIVTDQPGYLLLIKVADCQPVFIYDPVKRIIGNIHVGWRGSVNGIVNQTIETMKTLFNVKPSTMKATIGPSLGPCCAEFVHYQTELPEPFWTFQDRKTYFNFWQITKNQLMLAGINEANIQCANMCTKCHSDTFYSYRKEKQTGRFAGVIGLL